MKSHLKSIMSNYLILGSIIIGLIIAVTQVYMLLHYEFTPKYIIRIIFAIIYPIALILTGSKYIYALFFIFGIAIETQSLYDNWTAFFIVAYGCCLYESVMIRGLLLGCYALAVFFVAENHSKGSVFILVHVLTCILMYFAMQIRQNNIASVKLNPLTLTKDENIIVRQLSEGKLQKEITDFNKNTITKKVHDAMIRNNCTSREDLILRYKAFDSKIMES